MTGNDLGFVAMTLPAPDLCWNLTEESAANARLIAACPDLLEACRDALALCEGNGYSATVQHNLREAIRKATAE